MRPASLKRLGSVAAITGALLGMAFITGCKPKQVIVENSAAQTPQITGTVNWSAWNTWVQTPPRVVLVKDIDEDIAKLIARQSELFLTVTGQSRSAAPSAANSSIPATELERLKDAFMASSNRIANSPVPAVERWDRYSNTVQRMQADNLATTITTLEAYLRRDQQDLKPLLLERGDIGRQARSDQNWIDSAVVPLLEKLKPSVATGAKSPTLSAEQARSIWKTFESESLPEIGRAIEKNTVSSSTVNENGAFVLNGTGQLVVIVTVAGRDLYFPAETVVPGLRVNRD